MTGTRANAAVAATQPAASAKGSPGQDTAAVELPAGPVAESPTPGFAQLAITLGSIVAPTTLLTAVLYYFGLVYADKFFGYFGVDPTVLGLTPAYYISRGIGALVVPIIITAILAVLALWGDAAFRGRPVTESRRRALRILMRVAAIIGLALFVVSVWGAFATTVLTRIVAGSPIGLAVGVLLVAYAVRMRSYLVAKEQKSSRSSSPLLAVASAWAFVFVLVAMSLFAAAADVGAATGTSYARQFVAGLQNVPDVAVYSEQSLSLHAPGVREVRCHDPQAAYRFRYDGLRLIIESDDQYLLIPEVWTRAQGVAFLIPRSNSLRLEFYPPSTRDTLHPSTC